MIDYIEKAIRCQSKDRTLLRREKLRKTYFLEIFQKIRKENDIFMPQ